MECKFHVGQKVVCIKDVSEAPEPLAMEIFLSLGGICPQVGAVYTVRGIEVVERISPVGLYLSEIVNPPMKSTFGFKEVPFDDFCFRPLITRKADISQFKAMLNPSKVPA